jgi:hypothetical protein
MKVINVLAIGQAALLALGLAACGSSDSGGGSQIQTDGGAGASGAAGGGGTGGTSGTGGISGTGGTSGTGGSAGSAGASCGDFGLDATCKACLQSKCCDMGGACEANSDCAGLVTCVRACGADAGATCQQDCAAQFPNFNPDYFNLIQCKGDKCGTECPQATP